MSREQETHPPAFILYVCRWRKLKEKDQRLLGKRRGAHFVGYPDMLRANMLAWALSLPHSLLVFSQQLTTLRGFILPIVQIKQLTEA